MKTRVGYTGGRRPNPTYESVCAGDGHTEAMRVWFDPTAISFEQLLDKFFSGRSVSSACSARLQHFTHPWLASAAQALSSQRGSRGPHADTLVEAAT